MIPTSPNSITGANAGEPRQLTMRTRWAARVAQFWPVMSTSLLILMLGLFAACSQSRTAHVKADRALTAEEKRIVEIARRAVATNDTWVHRAEFRIPRKEESGGWSVVVWRLPATPGGFRIVTIDQNARVTEYAYGH
jgi:hypothetical protein